METEKNNTAQSTDDETIDIRQYLRVVEKRKWLILAVIATVFVLTGVWTLRQQKVYKATTSIMVETSVPKVLGHGVSEVVDLGTPGFWWNQEYIKTQLSVASSRNVADTALYKFPVLADPVFWGVGENIEEQEEKKKALEKFEPAEAVQGAIKVEIEKDTRIINISVEDTKPERAAVVANAVATAYVEGNLESKLETTKGAADWLGDQMAELRIGLEASEKALQQFKEDNDILTTSFEDRQRVISERLVMLSTELTKTRLKKVEQEARLRQARELREQSADDELGGEMARDLLKSPVITELKRRYVELKAQHGEFSERYDEKHPKLMGVVRQMAIVGGDLKREVDRLFSAEKSAYQETLEVEKRLEQMLASERTVAGNLNKKELSYNRLKREVENNGHLYEVVNRRLKEADLTGVLKTNNMRILDAALVPKIPIRPSVIRNMGVGLVAGLILALLLAFALEYLDNTIKGHEDVEQFLGVPFLGLIPSIATQTKKGEPIKRDLVVHDAPKSSAAECCRSLRTNLLFMSPDTQLASFVVTSAGPQEGKTTVANNLAIAMAQAGSKVLIVDTDMRRPRMHRVYGLGNEIGISSVIVGDSPIEDAIRRTGVEGLDILTCGPIPPNPAELLHSTAFKNLHEKLMSMYDRVIFDSPPVGAVTDPVILGTLTDGVVLVLKAGKTTREIAMQSTRAIMDANGRILGAVVNDLDIESRKYGYYYYSYYKKYGGYYGDYGSDNTGKPSGGVQETTV